MRELAGVRGGVGPGGLGEKRGGAGVRGLLQSLEGGMGAWMHGHVWLSL